MADPVSKIIFSAVDNTGAAIHSVRSGLNEVGDAISSAKGLFLGLAAAFGITSLSGGVKAASEAADAAAKLGDRFGVATEKMIGMQHAGDLAGVSNEGLTSAFRNMSKQAVEAVQGVQQSKQAFDLLKISAESFIKLPADQQFSLIIDRLHGLENATVRNAVANQLLGRQAGEVMNLVADGSAVFEQAQQDAEAWGLAINRVDAAKLEQMNDQLKRVEAASKGVATQIAVNLAPLLSGLAEMWADNSAKAKGYREEISQGSDLVIEAIGKMSNFVQGLRFAWAAAKLAVAEFATFTLEGIGKVLNIIPNEWGRQVTLMGESMQQTTTDIKAELDKLADEGLPADKLKARLREIVATQAQAAQQMAERRQAFSKMGETPDVRPEAFDAYTAGLARQIEALIEHNRGELQVIQEQYDRKQAMLDEAATRGILDEDLYAGQSALLFTEYEQAKTKLLDDEIKKRYNISNVYRKLDVQSASAWFGALGQLMESHSKAGFKIGQAASISKTIIDTYTAAQGAYAAFASIPYIGPALGAAAAAAAIAVGFARVQAIKSTQYGSSSATPVFNANPSTGVPTAPIGGGSPPPALSAAPAGGGTTIVVQIVNKGVVATDNGVQGFVDDYVMPSIEDAMNNRSRTLFNVQSRQARDLLDLVPG